MSSDLTTQEQQSIRRAINQMADKVHGNAVEKGFYEERETWIQKASRMCANMHDEVSEFHEAARNGKLDTPCDKAEKMRDIGMEPLTCAEEEIADMIIRALDQACAFDVDPGMAVIKKHAFNRTRPKKHGGKLS